MLNDNISISVEGVSKIYNLYDSSRERLKELFSIKSKKYHNEYHALNNINFEVKRGETFGVIGTNGAGKSTLLKLITGVATPTSGEIKVNGKISALLELGAGFNKNYTGLENIFLNGTMMGYTREEMEERISSIIEFADIGNFIYQPVKTYSSGMFARLAFAVAINIEPEILIIDEALSVGDVFFQNKCYKKFEELRSKNVTIIFVSHDIGTVKQLCSRVLWIEHGVQQMVGDSTEVCNKYANSILDKRAKEYDKNYTAYNSEENGVQEVKKLDLDNYPEISYTNESILNEDVKILSSFITDNCGERVSACKAGETYTLSIVFSSKRKIDECIAGFVIETVKGLWIINCNNLISGMKNNFIIKEQSINRVDFIFKMPALVNGDYVIGIAISEGSLLDFKVLTWLYNVLYLQIINVGSNDGILQLDSKTEIYSRDVQDGEI